MSSTSGDFPTDSRDSTGSSNSLTELSDPISTRSPPAEVAQPQHPRESSLVFRCEARDPRAVTSDSRRKPTAYHQCVFERYAHLNGTQEDQCWATGGYMVHWAHMIPHAESTCSRLVLWFQLMSLMPAETRARVKEKMSPLNLLPLDAKLHYHLHDNERRRALIRPTRADLHLLVRILEEHMAMEVRRTATLQESNLEWRPNWRDALTPAWPRQETVEGHIWNTYEYQVDFFDFQRCTLVNFLSSNEAVVLKEEEGDRRYPNALQDPLPAFRAPLCILNMAAYSVAQVRFISEKYQADFEQSFVEDMDVMSYVVHLLGSSSPDAYARMRRPASLPFAPPDLQVSQGLPWRQWPRVSQAGFRKLAAGADFSSSPHRVQTELASGVLSLHVRQASSEGEAEEQTGEGGADDGGGGAGDGDGESKRLRDDAEDEDRDDHQGRDPKRARLLEYGEGQDEARADRPEGEGRVDVPPEEEIWSLEEEENRLYEGLARKVAARIKGIRRGGDDDAHNAVDAAMFALVSLQGGPLSIDEPLRKIEERYDEILEAI